MRVCIVTYLCVHISVNGILYIYIYIHACTSKLSFAERHSWQRETARSARRSSPNETHPPLPPGVCASSSPTGGPADANADAEAVSAEGESEGEGSGRASQVSGEEVSRAGARLGAGSAVATAIVTATETAPGEEEERGGRHGDSVRAQDGGTHSRGCAQDGREGDERGGLGEAINTSGSWLLTTQVLLRRCSVCRVSALRRLRLLCTHQPQTWSHTRA